MASSAVLPPKHRPLRTARAASIALLELITRQSMLAQPGHGRWKATILSSPVSAQLALPGNIARKGLILKLHVLPMLSVPKVVGYSRIVPRTRIDLQLEGKAPQIVLHVPHRLFALVELTRFSAQLAPMAYGLRKTLTQDSWSASPPILARNHQPRPQLKLHAQLVPIAHHMPLSAMIALRDPTA
jgi:hypothetical protein